MIRYVEVVDVQVVELPGDVVDTTENIQLALEELHRMTIALRRHVTLVLHQPVLEVS